MRLASEERRSRAVGEDLTSITTAAVSTVESPRPPDYPAGEFSRVLGFSVPKVFLTLQWTE